MHEIKAKELPEIDDEFAAEVSEFDTLEEYKENKFIIQTEKEMLLKKIEHIEEPALSQEEAAAIAEVQQREEVLHVPAQEVVAQAEDKETKIRRSFEL